MTVYIVDLESIQTRYTCEWKTHLPKLIHANGHNVVVISGPDDLPNNTTPGMFLNFSATNIYKAAQVEKISRLFSDNKIKDGDYFLFTDAWHPGVINLKYMAELLGVKIKIGGCWHSGSYDSQDGLGRLIGDKPWVRYAERSFFWAIDHNYFATDFHIDLFTGVFGPEDAKSDWKDLCVEQKKIVRTGWPMEYMTNTMAPYGGMEKRDLIVFPHRIAPEKQVEIFRDLKEQLPEYEFVVCQDSQLTKNEYHNILGEAKMVFSASKQETLGIGCYEGMLVDAIPMVPDRLSYTEMYCENFKYPSEWTTDWAAYLAHRDDLKQYIRVRMDHYKKYLPQLRDNTLELGEQFFSANGLLANLNEE